VRFPAPLRGADLQIRWFGTLISFGACPVGNGPIPITTERVL
jgi:hypothetical protein